MNKRPHVKKSSPAKNKPAADDLLPGNVGTVVSAASAGMAAGAAGGIVGGLPGMAIGAVVGAAAGAIAAETAVETLLTEEDKERLCDESQLPAGHKAKKSN